MAHYLHEEKKKQSFPRRLQYLAKAWQKKQEPSLLHEQKLLKLWASGFFDMGYEREHLINLIDRGVFTIVPYLVEGDPKVLVSTLAANLRPWAYTTQLALNFLIGKMSLAERVFIPAAINSMFGAGITRTFSQYDRVISLEDEIIKIGTPAIRVIHDSDYVGDPAAKCREDFIIEGDIYKLPTEYARDLFAGKDKFGNQIADYIQPDCTLSTNYNPEKISNPNYNYNRLALRDYTTFIDVYLYDENTTVTIMPDGRKAKILREVEEDGPKESPYDYLGYKFFPNSATPLPPAWGWHDLDVTMNILAKTAREQAESQKDLILVEPSNKELGKKVTNASNMDVLVVKNPQDGVQKISLGGVNPENYNWMAFAEDSFNKTGATNPALGGQGPSSPTLGQEKIVFANASRIVNNMNTRFQGFMTSIIRKLAWRVWTDPTVYIPVIKPGIKEILGAEELPEVFSQADKVGDFYDFVFNVEPFSTQRMSPELRYQRMMQFMSQWVLPTMQLAAAQGAVIDIPLATRIMAEYQGMDNFNQIYKTSVPHELQGVGYQMQPGGEKKSKSPGQGNDSNGALIGSQEANSFRAETKEDNKSSIL